MENKSFFDRINEWVRTSVGLKVFTIAFLVLILLIPVAMVEDLIREREIYQQEVIYEVSQKWGEHQTVTAIVLNIPYHTFSSVKNDDGTEKIIKAKHVAHFLPTTLNISGDIKPEKRYRGIYEVVLYNCDLDIDGFFDRPNFKKLNIDQQNVEWDQATISLGLSDLRSIQNDVHINWNNLELEFDPGVKDNDVVRSGISTTVPVNDTLTQYKFKVNLNFNGSSGIGFTPLGKVTKVNVTSIWSEPKFDGAFLPDNREVNNSGFTANWEILHLNRNYPQEFTDALGNVSLSDFGVSLIMPVDEYQKNMRSVKYAVMFISLTFLIYFFSQIKTRIKIHPIQYLIVGLALCLFFTLLLALSEHISFGPAYLVASIAIIGMITAYSYFIFKDNLLTKILLGILIMLYGFIYVIIQLQDYSLLIGSIGLFIILGVIMYLSRNIDWYNYNSDSSE